MDIWHPENLQEEDVLALPLEDLTPDQLRQLIDRVEEIYEEVEDEEPDPLEFADPLDGEAAYDAAPKEVFRHVKELEEMGLAVPQITYIMHELARDGWTVDTTADTIKEAAESILSALKKEGIDIKEGGENA